MNLREMRDEAIPVAKAGSVAGVLDDKDTIDYETKTWDEPHPRGCLLYTSPSPRDS